MESGSIAAWNIGEGDSFGPGDVFCSVETDKATVDFEAQDEGVLLKILSPAGAGDLAIGTPIMVIAEDADNLAAFKDFVLDASPAAAAAAPAESTPPPPAAPAPAAPAVSATPAAAPSGDRLVASPLARKLAAELGKTLSSIPGSGPSGRILASDVQEFVPSVEVLEASAAMPASPLASPVAGHGYTDYPLTADAQEVAARWQQAKQNVPHYYLTVDVAMDQVLALRDTLNATRDTEIGVYEFICKAAASAMKAVPSANAAWMDSHVRVYEAVHMNVVLGAGDDLATPVLENVQTKGLAALSSELNGYVSALEDEEVAVPSGVGTFTVMNLGMYGIKACAPIIREPQACALAVGALETRIVPNTASDAEEIYMESVRLTATLSCDHRVVDGAVGAQWLSVFRQHLENPTTLLL
jgi:pyruvate dehydrogenase E2 component (dihydrolipoamide acetyltransferase)